MLEKRMVRIGICDDEPVICSQLERVILEFQNCVTEKFSIDVFYTGEELIDQIRKGVAFDLLFLDIVLGAVNGVEVGRVIREEMEDHVTKIVYISSKDGYDRQLFDVQPLHFLPKPLDPEKVFKDISLALKTLNRENIVFPFKIGHETYKIPIKEVIYFESHGRRIKLVCAKESFQFIGGMDTVAASLSGHRFMRPHRSYLINYDHAKSIGNDAIIMSNGERIPVSRLRSKEVRSLQATFEGRMV